MTIKYSSKSIILLNSLIDVEVQIYEKKIERTIKLQKTVKIILTREEHDQLKTAFCKGKGWSLGYPHTINVHTIILKANYKWMPTSAVEFGIKIE